MFGWISKLFSKSKPIDLTNQEILDYICKRYHFILTAKCVSSPIGFSTNGYWEYKARTTINNGVWFLVIDILDKIDSLTIKQNTEEDCVVCTNPVNESIKCCGQRVCKDCLLKIKEISKEKELDFKCPVCRNELDNYYTTHTFSKEYVDNLCGVHTF